MLLKLHLLTFNHEFALKDSGRLYYILGIEVNKTQDGILLSQQKYVSDLLMRVGMRNCKPIATPLSTSEKLLSILEFPWDQKIQPGYCSVVGTLQYLFLTRLDLAFLVNEVCQCFQSPTLDLS